MTDAAVRHANPVDIAARDQGIASRPDISAWVDASAGSGKTKVLTDRALRLMLAYDRPERILCLTFTKAAAAEMANRIVRDLSFWATEPDLAVRKKLLELTGADPAPATVARARALFARVVDAPGGLKVQTVHAFCQAALERFPVEAGAPPGFRALDERAAADLLTDARNAVLRRIMAGDAPADLAAALDRMAEYGGADKLDDVLKGLLAERGRIEALGGHDAAIRAALACLGFADEAAAAAAAAAAPEAGMTSELRRLAEAWRGGGKEDSGKSDDLGAWLSTDRTEALDDLFAAFFTEGGEGEPRKRIATKGVLDANPWFAEAHAEALAALEALRERRRAGACALDTTAALRLAGAVGDRYRTMKATRAALDFDDLILKTRDLLLREGGAGWALYKLDQGVDHILVDEAQDTNPEQWQVIHALAGEFFQEKDSERTLFAVGDPKQSIFSFQRADPAEFARSRTVFNDAAEGTGQEFKDVQLQVSFRSVPAVLAAVDAVFAGGAARDGLARPGDDIRHIAARAGLPGRVEFWPLMPAAEPDAVDAWTPLKAYPERGARADARLAERIAEKIKALIDDPAERLAPARDREGGRRIRAGDIMVVVQRRGAFGDALARALKAKGVATAGVDRMRLSRQLAVRDLLALGQVAVLPEDDLALACFLKSPLGGIDEDGLFRLAHGRGRTPLWQALKRAATGPAADAALVRAWGFVAEALARADYAPPFDFFQWALGPMQGRARIVAAMGEAAVDPLDEFLALALRYQGEQPASLSGFLAWIERESVEIKRELEGAAAGVRLMTAHAAKGLQAPVVFLPDTTGAGQGDRLRLFWAETSGGRAPLLGPSRKALDPPVVARLAAEREQTVEQERRRLLYVAMTRAEDRLYVAGWSTGRKGRQDGCWHDLIELGMDRLPDVTDIAADFSEDPILVYDDPGDAVAPVDAKEPSPPETEAPLPDWFAAPVPPLRADGPTAAATHAPSRAVLDEPDDAPAALSPLRRGGRRAEAALRFGRGLLIHRLLERLPGVPPAARARVGAAYLAGAADLDPGELQATLAAALRLIEDPAFGPVFAPEAIAEAPIAGVVGGRRYAGVIDRLRIDRDRVAIVDFKTNRPPPPNAAGTPETYLRQMALYRALARQAFPGRTVVAALLWTEAPRLDPLDDALLDRFSPEAFAEDGEAAALTAQPPSPS